MYDIKYFYYQTHSINKLHHLLNIVINSKKSHISTWNTYLNLFWTFKNYPKISINNFNIQTNYFIRTGWTLNPFPNALGALNIPAWSQCPHCSLVARENHSCNCTHCIHCSLVAREKTIAQQPTMEPIELQILELSLKQIQIQKLSWGLKTERGLHKRKCSDICSLNCKQCQRKGHSPDPL
jgi:hypothetical protein